VDSKRFTMIIQGGINLVCDKFVPKPRVRECMNTDKGIFVLHKSEAETHLPVGSALISFFITPRSDIIGSWGVCLVCRLALMGLRFSV
jgi:hypothetical protein